MNSVINEIDNEVLAKLNAYEKRLKHELNHIIDEGCSNCVLDASNVNDHPLRITIESGDGIEIYAIPSKLVSPVHRTQLGWGCVSTTEKLKIMRELGFCVGVTDTTTDVLLVLWDGDDAIVNNRPYEIIRIYGDDYNTRITESEETCDGVSFMRLSFRCNRLKVSRKSYDI